MSISGVGPYDRADEWLDVLVRLPAFVWPTATRLVIVSPHPDDETFGAGGLMSAALDRGLNVSVVSVTNGEAAYSHPNLAQVRQAELRIALERMADGRSFEHVLLQLPDGAVAQHLGSLETALHTYFRHDDAVFAPFDDDGHPDHTATAQATMAAAQKKGATVRLFPIWAYRYQSPEHSVIAKGQALYLSSRLQEKKVHAVTAYASQLEPSHPVVPASLVDCLCGPFECFVDPAVIS